MSKKTRTNRILPIGIFRNITNFILLEPDMWVTIQVIGALVLAPVAMLMHSIKMLEEILASQQLVWKLQTPITGES